MIFDGLMGKMNATGDAICSRLVPCMAPYPDDVTVKAPEVTRRVKEHGSQWCGKEDLRQRKNNSINYILETRLSIAEDHHPTRSWTGSRSWTGGGSKDWAGSWLGWTRPMVWTGSKDFTESKECNGFAEWTGSAEHPQSKDWTSSGDTAAKGNSFIDLLQTVPTSEDDEEVQGLLCLSRHPKVRDLTSDLERFEGQQTTEAEPVCETALRDLANEDTSGRQVAAQRPEMDFRKMQVTEVFLKIIT